MVKTRIKRLVVSLCMAVLSMFFAVNIAWVLNSAVKGEVPPLALPRIEIDLLSTTLEELNFGEKDVKYSDNIVQIDVGGEMWLQNEVEIKGRGNSTWGKDKKPYQIKFSQKIDLFGMGKAKKWILLANAYDDSNMRNDIAFYIEKMLGEPYALKGEFVELIIDGEWLGLYYVTPKIEIGKNRVDLRDELGILVEVDNLHIEEEHFLVKGIHLQLKDLVVDDNIELAKKDFSESLEKMMLGVKEKDLDLVSAVADVESMARYYLLSEFTKNPDAYASSFFLYKNGIDDKIHFGPGWDFDFSMGNKQWIWGDEEDFYLPSTTSLIEYYDPLQEGRAPWGIDDPEFYDLVARMYREKMMGKKAELLEYFDKKVAEIQEIAMKDAGRWEKNNFEDLINLRRWIEERFDYFDEIYGEAF